MAEDERWKLIPYDYAYNCIALLLTFDQAVDGLRNRLSPEQAMFKAEGWDDEKIRYWNDL